MQDSNSNNGSNCKPSTSTNKSKVTVLDISKYLLATYHIQMVTEGDKVNGEGKVIHCFVLVMESL